MTNANGGTIGRKRRISCRRAGIACSAAAAIAACSGDPSASSGSAGDMAAVRACELLTQEQIQNATGIAAAAGRDASQVGGRVPICQWPPAAGPEFETLVSLLVSLASYGTYDDFLESARSGPLADAFEDVDVQPIEGVGKFGVWMAEMRMLQVYGDVHMVQVTIDDTSTRDPLEAARSLAVAALGRLP